MSYLEEVHKAKARLLEAQRDYVIVNGWVEVEPDLWKKDEASAWSLTTASAASLIERGAAKT